MYLKHCYLVILSFIVIEIGFLEINLMETSLLLKTLKACTYYLVPLMGKINSRW